MSNIDLTGLLPAGATVVAGGGGTTGGTAGGTTGGGGTLSLSGARNVADLNAERAELAQRLAAGNYSPAGRTSGGDTFASLNSRIEAIDDQLVGYA